MIIVYVTAMEDGEVVPAVHEGDHTSSADTVAAFERFAFIELTGQRFDAPGMPLDALRELSNLRDAVMAAARERWLEAHPERARVPSGFAESLDLRLLRVERGSARPVFYLNTSAVVADEEVEPFPVFYKRGLDRIAETVMQVNRTGTLASDQVSSAVRDSVRKIGSSLQVGETLSFGDPKDGEHQATITEDTVRILQRIEDFTSGPTPIDIVGFIVEYDSVGRSFRLATATGTAVCNLDDHHPELALRVKEYLAADGITAPDVMVRGMSDNPQKSSPTVDSVFRVNVVRRVSEKALALEVLSTGFLRPGWLEPGSDVPDKKQTRSALAVADLLLGLEIEGAHAIPSGAGAIVFEWRTGPVEMTVSIDPGGKLFLCADDTETGQLIESEGKYSLPRVEAFVRGHDVNE